MKRYESMAIKRELKWKKDRQATLKAIITLNKTLQKMTKQQLIDMIFCLTDSKDPHVLEIAEDVIKQSSNEFLLQIFTDSE